MMISTIEYESMPKFTFRKDTRNTKKLFLFVIAAVIVIFFPKETIFPFSLTFILVGFVRGVILHLTQGDEEVVDLSRYE